MKRVEYIVVHTAADGTPGVNRDTSAREIDRWHRERGWEGIGYHYVVRLNGAVERGRDEGQTGAHCLGLNSRSLGVCLSGHGDYHGVPAAQWGKLIRLCVALCRKHGLASEAVIGHREVGRVAGPRWKTSKSCPGKMVDMDGVRAVVASVMAGGSWVAPERNV